MWLDTPWRVECVPYELSGAPFGGPVQAQGHLADHVGELTASGLFGQVHLVEEVDREGAYRVELWAGAGERAEWLRRVELSARSAQARDLLAAAGEFKAASWRREQAMERLRRRIWSACQGGPPLSRSDLARVAQVARGTVYATLAEPPPPAEEPPPADEQERVETPPPARPAAPAAFRGGGGAVGEPVRMPMGHNAPCVVCHLPATFEVDGDAVHTGECLRQHREGTRAPAIPLAAQPAPAPPAEDVVAETTPAQDDPPTADLDDKDRGQPVPPLPASPQSPADRPERTAKPARPSPSGAGRGGRRDIRRRFEAPAAAMDSEALYLPGGQRHAWEATHLGQIAALVGTYRLGHGGGKALPDPGEIWLYPDVVEDLGLPVEVNADDLGDRVQRGRARREVFEPLLGLPAVADALAEGWVLGQGGTLGPRTYIKHPRLLPQGAHLVFVPWTRTLGVALLTETDPEDGQEYVVDPEVLVERLREFADLLGVTWRVREGTTGMALIAKTRPPRKVEEELSRRDVRVRAEAAELPPFLRATGDGRFSRYVEQDYSWWRTWDSLTRSERDYRYVHAYDHRSHYLNAWSSTSLGIEDLVHLVGEAARWPGDEKAGYWLVDRWDGDWPNWALPDPIAAVGAFVDEGRVWVTCHTLRQLDKLIPHFTDTLTFHEAWTWREQAAYLGVAGRRLAAARAAASAPVAATVKGIYASTTTKLASVEQNLAGPWYRPDWRDMIVGAARTAIVALVAEVAEKVTPLAIARDTIIYPSHEADPVAAWPGRPEKLGALGRGWRPVGSARLDQWGPTALAERAGLWSYLEHMRALSPPGQA